LLQITINKGCVMVTELCQAVLIINKFVGISTLQQVNWQLACHILSQICCLSGTCKSGGGGSKYVICRMLWQNNDFCVTGFDWSLHFKWISLSSEQKAQHSDPTEPFLWVINVASLHQTLLLHHITCTHYLLCTRLLIVTWCTKHKAQSHKQHIMWTGGIILFCSCSEVVHASRQIQRLFPPVCHVSLNHD
jgi:hypothetical protein